MPPVHHHHFHLAVDAVKNVPVVGPKGDGTEYMIQWYYDETNQGGSPQVAPKGDEVAFDVVGDFVVEHSGVISRLLQLNCIAVKKTGERELAGVLMIDLNAHVPKPPSKSSRQRATLHMSRCPGPKPLLIRLTVNCVPTTAPARAVVAPQRAPTTTARPSDSSQQRSSTSPAPQSAPSADVQDHINRLRATITTLSSANEQLRDENTVLRQAANRARDEPDYTYFGSGGRGPSASPIPQSPAHSHAAEESEALQAHLQTEIRTLNAELAILQRGMQSAKEQIRNAAQREENYEREISMLNREKKALEDEVHRLRGDAHNVNLRYEAALGITSEDPNQVASLRETLTATQQMNRDLKAMLDTSQAQERDTADSLLEVKQEVVQAERKYKTALELHQKREQEALARADAAESALRAAEAQCKELHAYCITVHNKCKLLMKALEHEKQINERRKRKNVDLKAMLRAHAIAEREDYL